MTRWLRAARGDEGAPTKPTELTKLTVSGFVEVEETAPGMVVSAKSVLSADELGAALTGWKAAPSENSSEVEADPPSRHGLGPNGNPRTWTGRVVSLDDWRRLSAWERHGSTGQLWNGMTRQWEPEGGKT